ncbi:unnamed protein product [Larinioides sclopetarius]|uniref:Uncharacterized protein n=1 Tax=Larinioides sclopetarius TaxID=280406 RepID=A0AAV2B7F7_9ARAC
MLKMNLSSIPIIIPIIFLHSISQNFAWIHHIIYAVHLYNTLLGVIEMPLRRRVQKILDRRQEK